MHPTADCCLPTPLDTVATPLVSHNRPGVHGSAVCPRVPYRPALLRVHVQDHSVTSSLLPQVNESVSGARDMPETRQAVRQWGDTRAGTRRIKR